MGGALLYSPVFAAAPTVNNTVSGQGTGSCTPTISGASDIVIVSITATGTTSTGGISSVSGIRGDSSYVLQESSPAQFVYTGYYVYTFIFSAKVTSSGGDTITGTPSGSITTGTMVMNCIDTSGLSSITASVVREATAASGAGTPATSSASYPANAILVGTTMAYVGCAGPANPTITAGSGYTLIAQGSYTYQGTEYEITTSSGSTTFPFGSSCNTGYGITGAVFVSTVNYTLTVSTLVSLAPSVKQEDVKQATVTVTLSNSVSSSHSTTSSAGSSGYFIGDNGSYLFFAMGAFLVAFLALLVVRRRK